MDKWTRRFLDEAKTRSTWSKDPSRKIGAVAVKDLDPVAYGFNGFPRGIRDSDERLSNRELKYKYIVHAEQNMIYNACRQGKSLLGTDVYVYGLPVCSECAKGLIQAGVRSVTCLVEQEIAEPWLSSWKRTCEMFDEVGLKYELIYESDNCRK